MPPKRDGTAPMGNTAKRRRGRLHDEVIDVEAEVEVDNSTTPTAPIAEGSNKDMGSPQPSGNAQLPSSQQPKRKRTSKPKLTSTPSQPEGPAEPLPPTIMPPYFQSLFQTHSALNTVSTFLSSRKNVITTFDTLKPAVERHLPGRQLLVEDIASIKALRPEGIRFEYVDYESLQLDAMTSEKDEIFRTAGSRGGASMPDDSSTLGVPAPGSGVQEGGEEVLFLEFIDEDLKRETGKGKGIVKRGRTGLKEVKMPTFSLEGMKKLIEKRDDKFKTAAEAFVRRCEQEKLDPEIVILQRREVYLPQRREQTPGAASQQPRAPLMRLDTIPDAIPKERKSIPEIVQELKDSPWYTGQIVPDGHRVFDEQPGIYGDLDFLLSQDLVNALYNARGITKFYAHQAEAINALNAGYNVVVSTSTSSGKSLIYQLPVVKALEEDPRARAIFVFPTKALAQDQGRGLRELIGFMPGMEDVKVETYDGDTPWEERNVIRDEASVIFTNPDMLHLSILPNEGRWRGFLKSLKFVVGEFILWENPTGICADRGVINSG